MPRVLNKRCDAVPLDAIYVGRPTAFGNPFVVGRDGGQGECVRLHEDWLKKPEQEWLRKRIREELRGHDLVCWCAPKLCHADTLLALANERN